MGRTLHYKIETVNGKKFTRKECETIINLSYKYNQNEKLWSCENLWIDPYDYIPAWNNRGDGGKADSWEQINARYKELEKQKLHYIDIVKQLVKEKLVYFAKELSNSFGGFVKVQGNELNSLMVFTGLVELSTLLSNIKIHLSDEGEFLYCPLYIRKGKVIPDVEDVVENIERWTRIHFLNSNVKLAREIRENFPKNLDKHMTDKIFDSVYKYHAEKYLKQEMERYANVVRLIGECWTEDAMICNHNLLNSPVEHWFDPELWHRVVNPEMFENYTSSPATMMDGFDGEAFGLSDENVEKKSYEQIAKIQKLIAGTGLDMEVLGEVKK